MTDYTLTNISTGAWRLEIIETGGPWRVFVDSELWIESEETTHTIEHLSQWTPHVEVVPLDAIDAGFIPAAQMFGPFARIHGRTPSIDMMPDLPITPSATLLVAAVEGSAMITDAKGYLIAGAEEDIPEGKQSISVGIGVANETGTATIAVRPDTPEARLGYSADTGKASISDFATTVDF